MIHIHPDHGAFCDALIVIPQCIDLMLTLMNSYHHVCPLCLLLRNHNQIPAQRPSKGGSRQASHVEQATPPSNLRSIQVAQVAVPADADDVNEQHAVLERHVLEVDGLHRRPHHVVGRQRVLVVLVQLVLRLAALKERHAAQEHADHDGREHALVEGYLRGNRGVLGLELHVSLQEAEPLCGGGAEDDCRGGTLASVTGMCKWLCEMRCRLRRVAPPVWSKLATSRLRVGRASGG